MGFFWKIYANILSFYSRDGVIGIFVGGSALPEQREVYLSALNVKEKNYDQAWAFFERFMQIYLSFYQPIYDLDGILVDFKQLFVTKGRNIPQI